MLGLSPVVPSIRISGPLCAGPCGGKDVELLDGVGEMDHPRGAVENIPETNDEV